VISPNRYLIRLYTDDLIEIQPNLQPIELSDKKKQRFDFNGLKYDKELKIVDSAVRKELHDVSLLTPFLTKAKTPRIKN
jgi:hypothetical protein